VVTTLDNPWLNLVRFDSGDLVRPAPATPCACGRRDGPQLLRVEGRAADLLVAADGRLVTPRAVDDALATAPGLDGLLHFRLVQRAARELDLELVARPGAAPLEPGAAVAALAELLGVAPRARVVRSVPPEASGKLRLCAAAHVDAARLAAAVPAVIA
jgi:phenylacetate-CoA ligase